MNTPRMKGIKSLRTTGKAARMQDGAAISQIDEILQSAGQTAEFGRFEEVPIGDIKLDPDQPRKIHLSLAELKACKSDDPQRQHLMDSIHALAASMQRVGQKTPIDVYQEGLQQVLIAGERRYWAGRLLGWNSLHAKILPSRPADLRLRQLVENVARQDLTPPEILGGLKALVSEAQGVGIEIAGAGDLISAAGMSKTSAYRWWAILNAPEDVQSLVDDGFAVTSVERVATIKDAASQKEAIVALRSSGSTRDDEVAKQGQGVAAKRRARAGRPKSFSVKFTDAATVATIYRLLGGDDSSVNWEDGAEAKAALEELVARLDKGS